MLSLLIKSLKFLRLIDDNNLLSLTNLSMYIALYRLFETPTAGFGEIGAFLISASVYSYKKVLDAKN